jgi:hypothetical protein
MTVRKRERERKGKNEWDKERNTKSTHEEIEREKKRI